MSIVRGLFAFLAIGAALLAIGLPLTGTTIPIDAVVDRLGNDYFVLVLVGGIAIAGAASVQIRRRIDGIHQATPPDTEGVHVVPTLGADLDDYLAAPLGIGVTEPSKIHARLFRLAVTVVMQEHGCTRDEARARVEAGDWTTDPYAASYLGAAGSDSLSPRQQLRAALDGDSTTQHAVRRTATEILRRESGVVAS